jgi:alkylhydroperoxidase family enzyme
MMRLQQTRISPLGVDEPDQEQQAVLAALTPEYANLNVYRTLVRSPRAFERLVAMGVYVRSQHNGLSPRERELIILRTSYLCKAGYEWAQHSLIGLRAGLLEAEIQAIKRDTDKSALPPQEKALLRATDELHETQFISNKIWAELRKYYSDKQCMDLIYTSGHYTVVSMLTNSVGMQLDPGLERDPDLENLAG